MYVVASPGHVHFSWITSFIGILFLPSVNSLNLLRAKRYSTIVVAHQTVERDCFLLQIEHFLASCWTDKTQKWLSNSNVIVLSNEIQICCFLVVLILRTYGKMKNDTMRKKEKWVFADSRLQPWKIINYGRSESGLRKLLGTNLTEFINSNRTWTERQSHRFYRTGGNLLV